MPTRSLLRSNRNFRSLYYAKVGSEFGDWFNQVALGQVTLAMTHSPVSMGLVLLCRSLPGVILGPLVSPVVDRYPKRFLLYISDLMRMVFALGYCFAVLNRLDWLLYVNSVFLGLAGILFSPARNAVIPQVVDRQEWNAANSLESGTAGIIQMIGAVCGGLVTASVSPVAAFVINAGSYLWSALCIMRAKWSEPNSTAPSVTYLQSLKQGFQEASRNKVVRAIILIGIGWGLAGGGYYVAIPLLGAQTYHLGGLGIGLLFGIDGLGVWMGALLTRRFVRNENHLAVLWYGAAYLTQAVFFSLMTQSTLFVLGAIALLLMRISSGVIIPLGTYLLQTFTAPEKRGRVFALHSSTYGGVMQVSYAVTGYAFARFGLPPVGLAIGAMSLLSGVYWLLMFGRHAPGHSADRSDG